MRKGNMKKIVMAITTAVVVVGAAVSSVIPVFAEPGEESAGSIVVNEGETVLNTEDADVLQNELDILYREVPEIVRIPDEGLTRKNALKSKGAINYNNGTVLIRAADFAYLADEIDALEYAYKINLKNALNSINTYFPADGTIVRGHDMANKPEESALSLSFAKLYEGIRQSQSVEHLASQQIYAAIADNLSLGTAAWVNGELIIGNGADNQTLYEKGYIDGFNKATDSVDISYVYHEHVGEQSGAGSGCYRGKHVHNWNCATHEEVCGKDPVEKLDIETGSSDTAWFMCGDGHHFITSSSGGSCSYKETVYDCNDLPYNTYDIVCGKTSSTIESAIIVFR